MLDLRTANKIGTSKCCTLPNFTKWYLHARHNQHSCSLISKVITRTHIAHKEPCGKHNTFQVKVKFHYRIHNHDSTLLETWDMHPPCSFLMIFFEIKFTAASLSRHNMWWAYDPIPANTSHMPENRWSDLWRSRPHLILPVGATCDGAQTVTHSLILQVLIGSKILSSSFSLLLISTLGAGYFDEASARLIVRDLWGQNLARWPLPLHS